MDIEGHGRLVIPNISDIGFKGVCVSIEGTGRAGLSFQQRPFSSSFFLFFLHSFRGLFVYVFIPAVCIVVGRSTHRKLTPVHGMDRWMDGMGLID